MNKMLFLLAILSVPSFMVAEKEKEETEASSPFDRVRTEGFPYVWRYKGDITAGSSYMSRHVSGEALFRLARCTLCKQFAEAKFDKAELDKIIAACEKFMINEPERGLFRTQVPVDPQVQAIHDKAMALYNCAIVCRERADLFALQKELNNLFSRIRTGETREATSHEK